MNRAVQEIRDGRAGRLVIATSPTLVHALLPRAIALFRQRSPGVHVSIQSLPSPLVVERVARREVDMGIVYAPVVDPGVDAEKLVTKLTAPQSTDTPMNVVRIKVVVCAIIIGLTGLFADIVLGQAFPAKPVKIVVGSAAGGPIDLVARLTAQKLSDVFNQQFLVENRTGAGGTIAGEYVARSNKDGHTLYMGSAATLCIAPALYPKLPYDPVRDFSPISVVASTSFVLVVHPSVPARSVKEFIALAKKNPGQLRFGSAGSGSATHLSAELFKSMAKIDVVHVPYKGGSQAIIDVLSGQIDFMFDTLPNSRQHVGAGKLRALGMTGSERSPLMRDLPTIAEAGVADFESTTWFGLLAPAGTSRDSINRLSTAVRKVVGTEDLKQRMLSQGLEPVGSTPEAFARLIKLELPKWAKVVQASGAKVD